MQQLNKILAFLLCSLLINTAKAQFLMDIVDTTKETGRGILNIYKNFNHLQVSSYLQPQFQIAQEKSINSFEGPDFGTNVSNRFMLRRSRLKIEYVHFEATTKPNIQIVFQIDANERGFTLRDMWGRIFENKYKLFSFTTGVFARPFGFETNLSSSDRESPERGRMNQLLMKSERDLGAMISFDARKNIGWLSNIKLDVGVFNGQGIGATGDFDNNKDFIGRLSLKPIAINKKIFITAGTSILQGALLQNTKYSFSTSLVNGIKTTIVDSSLNNVGKNAPRHYYGADVQIKIKNKIGFTELRGEIIAGKHAVLANSNETPTTLLSGYAGYYIRNFNGAYFYFLQHLFSTKHQLIIKYDWFDPNTKVATIQIGAANSNFTAANIKYSTLGIGYINYISENAKLVLYYSNVWNEKTLLTGYTNNLKDNVFTCRMQFRF